MIIKATGRTVGTMGHLISYLGTAGDHTPAHQNPGKTDYFKAKTAGNQQEMRKYSVYTRRDLMTFGNFDTRNEKTISAEVKRFMSNNRRKIQSREFVLMPSDAEKVNPHDPSSIRHFAKFVQMFIDRHFQNNFHYYACIQPDSHQHSKVHTHIVVINDNLATGRAMSGKYYDVRHLRRDLQVTAKAYNARFRDFSFQPVKSKQLEKHQPSKLEKRIISASRSARKNPAVTSRPKFIAYLARHHVKAIYRKGHVRTWHHKGHRLHRVIPSGWKYKWVGDNSRHSYIKASRISKATGGSFLSANAVKLMLSSNRKLKAQRKRSRSAEVQSEPSFKAHSASSSSSSSDIQKSSESSPNVENQANKKVHEAQRLARLQQQRLEVIRIKRNMAIRQRKEQMNHERRRLSEQAAKRFTEMARIRQQRHRQAIQQSGALPETLKPTFVGMADGDNNSSDTGKKDSAESRSSAEEQRPRRSRQGNASPTTDFFSQINRVVKRIKRFKFKAKIKRFKRRIAKAIVKRIKRIRTKVEKRIRNIEHQRQQRNAEHERKAQQKRQARWQREQGGIQR